jgi:hypothetical protein
MKKIFTVFIFFCSCLLLLSADTTKVLFVGNSYTYSNDLPTMFKLLSASGGKAVATDMSAPGGYTFELHYTYQPTFDLIGRGGWNYVILQEQSQYPTIEYYRYNSTYPFGRKLDSLIKLKNSNTLFFMTWGREFGGQQCIDSHCSPVFTSFYHMQDSLKSAYNGIANTLNASVAPVGEGWRTAKLMDTSIALWESDNSHPSLKGSYLAACMFYITIFHQSPVGLIYTAGLSMQEALFLQNAANLTPVQVAKNEKTVPENFYLYQNYPNPFNPTTKIKFSIPLSLKFDICTLKLFDILGREIVTLVNKQLSTGMYEVDFDGTNYSSGVYYYQLTAGDYSETKKMLMIK